MANEWNSSAEDRITYDDSDQFDEDSMSLCSWLSENEIVGGITWRGWKKAVVTASQERPTGTADNEKILSLTELSAKVIARNYPFQTVEEYQPPIPEEMQLKIAFWSFPQCEDDIQLYSCLAHASVEEFQKSELILKLQNIQDVMQIGFHLSGIVPDNSCNKPNIYKVAVTFDRCKIVSTSCTCQSNATWCAHISALCLFRMRHPKSVSFHAPISESLSKLSRYQLQKFAQYLINDLPPQILQTSQKLLDEILNKPDSAINSLNGAPDPTAGASHLDRPKWCLNETALHEHIRKVLCKLCGPSPTAFLDINSAFLTSSAPHISLEWSNYLRPLISREPEGLWNLLDIIKDLFKLKDPNACKVLQIFTEECLNFHQMALWWFCSETELGDDVFYGRGESFNTLGHAKSNLSNSDFLKHAGARLLDESVNLWKVAVMDPSLTEIDKRDINAKLQEWQKIVLEKASKGIQNNGDRKFAQVVQSFQGFLPAVAAVDRDYKAVYDELDIDPGELQAMIHDELSSFTAGVEISADLFSSQSFDELFDCLSTLHTLGFEKRAQNLAVLLTRQLLSSNVLKDDNFQASILCDHDDTSTKASKQLINIFRSDRLSGALKSSLLCNVLKENSDSHHLAFKIALLGLSLPRGAASSKSLEVKLVHSEMMLHSVLKMMIITNEELDLIRSHARLLANMETKSNHSMITPIVLAVYIFEVLCNARVQSNLLSRCKPKFGIGFQPTTDDGELGFRSAIKTLGRETGASEMQCPMLCESMRRQCNDLALSMLWHYRDAVDKTREILSVMLDMNRYGYCNENDVAVVRNDSPVQTSNGNAKESFNKPVHRENNGVKIKPRSSWMENVDRGERERNQHSDVVEPIEDEKERHYQEQAELFGNSLEARSFSMEPKEDWDAEARSSSMCYDKALGQEADHRESLNALNIGHDGGSTRKCNIESSPIGHASFLRDLSLDGSIVDDMKPEEQCLHTEEPNKNEDNEQQLQSHENQIEDIDVHGKRIRLTGRFPTAFEDVIVSGLNDVSLHTESHLNLNTNMGEADCISPSYATEHTDSVSELNDASLLRRSSTANAGKINNQSSVLLSEDEQLCSRDQNEKILGPNKDLPSKTDATNSPEDNLKIYHFPVLDTDGTNTWDPAMCWEESCEMKNVSHERTRDLKGMSHQLSSFRRMKFCKKNDREFMLYKRKIELNAFSLFELARNVLSRASEQYDRDNLGAADDDMVRNVHQGLRLVALEIGLFSLRLQNLISPKWLSRTYSSQFSWIATQAIEIGHRGLCVLNDKWEGVLTPAEVVDIASRASRLGESLLKRTAAELALSSLPQADMLNPGEIHNSLTMCKEQDTEMLERACSSIETASRSGSIQPEILFLIARQWHYIHGRLLEDSKRDLRIPSNDLSSNPSLAQLLFTNSKANDSRGSISDNHITKTQLKQSQGDKLLLNGNQISTEHCTILTPEQYVQQQMHRMAQQMLSRSLSQAGGNFKVPDEVASFSWIYPHYLGSLHHHPMPQYVLTSKNVLKTDTLDMPLVTHSSDRETCNVSQQLQNAYRVGMKALELLAGRPPEERANVKFASSPPCADDIRWMCALAASLGPQHLKSFCSVVVGAVSSPFVLHDIALEAARNLAMYNPAQLASHLRSPCVNPIVLKCLAMYTELVRHDLTLLSQGGYADFVDLLRKSRSAFCMAPGGMTKFNDLLEMIRKKYSKKKELWQLIMSGLSRA